MKEGALALLNLNHVHECLVISHLPQQPMPMEKAPHVDLQKMDALLLYPSTIQIPSPAT